MTSPQRMCIVCRGAADKEKLLRFYCRGDTLAWDSAQRAGGRGAYIHPTLKCLKSAALGPGLLVGRLKHALRLVESGLSKSQMENCLSEVALKVLQIDLRREKTSGPMKIRL